MPKVDVIKQDWDIVVNATLEKLADKKILDVSCAKKDWTPKPEIDEDSCPSIEEMHKIMERYFPSVHEPVETKHAKAVKKKAICKTNCVQKCRWKKKNLHSLSKISI